MKRKDTSDKQDVRMSTRIERKISFTTASITEALRDYLHKHNKEVPPSNASLYLHDLCCFGGKDEKGATLSWNEYVRQNDA